MSPKSFPDISPSFHSRKAQILEALGTPDDTYTDKSPKGSVDVQIRDLIAEINAVDGWVTTSSCSGRVAVFAEGNKDLTNSRDDPTGEQQKKRKEGPAGPGGKGHGGRWLFVSHEPIPISTQQNGSNVTNENEGTHETTADSHFTDLFGLHRHQEPSHNSSSCSPEDSICPYIHPSSNLRLIRLMFSPLILHVLCASLHHARPLLSAAINAGFRESGVQSLKALDDPDAGVMVAIRTAGLSSETIVGIVKEAPIDEGMDELMEALVGEQYLRTCVYVMNERFAWNDLRRERLREELKKALKVERRGQKHEDVEVRRTRKRKEGLRKREEKEKQQSQNPNSSEEDSEILLPFDIG